MPAFLLCVAQTLLAQRLIIKIGQLRLPVRQLID